MKIPSVTGGASAAGILLAMLAILFLSVSIGLIVPGIIAAQGSVFYQKDLIRKLPPAIRERLDFHERQRLALSAQIDELDRDLASPESISSSDIEAYLKLRESLARRLTDTSPPVAAIAFYLNPQMLLWPAIYTCLGWLLIVFRPTDEWSVIKNRTALWLYLSSSVYAVYEWPMWARNFILGSEGRSVFAYPNVDIHAASFFAQEGLVLGFCGMLAALWLQWCHALDITRAAVRQSSSDPYRYVLGSTTLDELSRAFLTWQLSSVVLCAEFLFFTNFFWELVARYHDARYMLSAITAHLLWGISWATMTLPLLARWRAWIHAKNLALAQSASFDEFAKLDGSSRASTLKMMEPLSGYGVSISGIAAVTSFLLPIVQLFHR